MKDNLRGKAFIVKSIQSMSGKYTRYQIFQDWVECSALAITNNCELIHDDVWNEREECYKQIMNKYELKERQTLSAMFQALIDEFDERLEQKNLTDVLGEIYMELGAGNKNLGQVFTPYCLALMCAKLALDDGSEDFTFNEPACGGGVMIIGVAQNLLEKGINYQRKMHGVCQDLDRNCVFMCYVQLSLLGIDAIVVQGDTIRDPYHINYPKERMYRTPKNTGMLI